MEQRYAINTGTSFGGDRENKATERRDGTTWRVDSSSADACATYEGPMESKVADPTSIRASLSLGQGTYGDH